MSDNATENAERQSEQDDKDRQKIVFAEMVKQIGDLGNYILKAFIAIFGVGFAGLIFVMARQGPPVERLFTNGQMVSLLIVSFLCLAISLWWITRTFVKMHAHLKSQLPTSTRASSPSPSLARLMWVDDVPIGARAVVMSLIVFLVFAVAQIAIWALIVMCR